VAATSDIFALADLVESAALVAVIVAVVLVFTAGAVYMPAVETVPADAVHVTPVFDVFVTAAWNCAVVPELRVVVPGVTVTPMTGAISAIVAAAHLVESAALVAVTTAAVLVVTVGAV
jgi:hypothetical protein